jgi:hypothetical protein
MQKMNRVVWSEKFKIRTHLENLVIDWKVILKRNLKNKIRESELVSVWGR